MCVARVSWFALCGSTTGRTIGEIPVFANSLASTEPVLTMQPCRRKSRPVERVCRVERSKFLTCRP